MKVFEYNDRLYLRVVPAKSLFSSTTIHNVVTRGDFFGVDIETGYLTVIPGHAVADLGDHTVAVQSVAKQIRSATSVYLLRKDGSSRKLSKVTSTAIKQIAFERDRGFRGVKLKVESPAFVHFLVILESERWDYIKNRVLDFYEAYVR